ncbi:unnamed protein product [Hymenolepis diminuta]|uniref:DUF2012 domain-containing protein n=1 Tax=Hymenolepis diminuta TaxID=6216 RepID=A0A158QET0_HYMDI|nr:unnamed protein product [Hymenolepis diminuta]VUZ47421.1 unnamed protein product [Hymenolepis diminuta]
MNKYFVFVFLALHFVLIRGTDIEGIIIAPSGASSNWAVETKVRVDGKRYFGFVKPDGSFVISEVAPGSYLVEFTNPTYLFQPVRVDINSKGKIRARNVNVLRTTAVKAVPHPLRITTVGKAMYFQPREQLRTLDLLLNPHVLIMLVPFLFIMVMPKLMDTNDPEFAEMQKNGIFNTATSGDTPDISEYLSSLTLAGGPPKKQASKKTTNSITGQGSNSADAKKSGNVKRRN